MQKETLSSWQTTSILFLLIMGSTVVNLTSKAEQDMWFSVLLSLAMAIPLCLLYARIMRLFPAANLYEIAESLFGRWAGGAIAALFFLYAVITGATVLRESAEFSKITAMHLTPTLVLLLAILAVVIHLTLSGGEVFGRFSVFIFPIIIGVFAASFILSYNELDPRNLQPVLSHPASEILESAAGFLSNPLADTVLLLGMAGMVKREASPYRFYVGGTVLGAVCILINLLRTLMILGFPYNADALFPQYLATRTIDVANVITRIEGITSATFFLVAIIKVAVCVYAAAFGMGSLFRFQKPNTALVPCSLVILAIAFIGYNSIQDVLGFLKVYRYFAAPFQLILPLIIWITAEIRVGKGRRITPGGAPGAGET